MSHADTRYDAGYKTQPHPGPAPRYKEWSGCTVTVVTQTSPARGYGGSAVSSPIGVWSSAPEAIGFCVV